MCGRYTLTAKPEALVASLREGYDGPIEVAPELGDTPPRYNVAPTQHLPIWRHEGDRLLLTPARWGLVPPWTKELGKGPLLINARADTVAERPAFRHALRSRRCLVPADGFFEWKTEGKAKHAFYFDVSGGRPFAFAGLWERWDGPDGVLESYTLVTTAPNGVVAEVHDRMPVILPAEAYATWLDPELHNPARLVALLAPYPASRMRGYEVDPRVGSVRNDDPEIIRPLASSHGGGR